MARKVSRSNRIERTVGSLDGAASILYGVTQIMGASSMVRIAEYNEANNATLAAREFSDTMRSMHGMYDERDRLLGAQRQRVAASGVTLTGSAALAAVESTYNLESQLASVRYAAEYQEIMRRNAAAMATYEAAVQAKNARMQGIGNIVGGVIGVGASAVGGFG